MTSRQKKIFAVLAAGLAATACAQLAPFLAGRVSPPEIAYEDASLVQAPSRRQLIAYLCPRALRQQGRIGAVSDALCAQLFGRAPDSSSLQISFDVRFRAKNPNAVPLPLSSLLTAVTVFPQSNAQQLGAVCLHLCPPDQPACAGGAGGDACRKAPGDIRGIEDFPGAVTRMLVAEGLAAGAGQKPSFRLPELTAGAELPVTARLSFTPEVFLPVLEQIVRQSIDELTSGRGPSLTIPYKLEGTLFSDVGSLGRVAAGFGPSEGTWQIPTEALIPQL